MGVVDSTFLTLLLRPEAGAPRSASGTRVTRVRDRIDLLVETLDKERTTIIVPAPVLAEILVLTPSDQVSGLLELLNRKARFRVAAFDMRAAVEHAALMHKELRGGKKSMKAGDTWAKVKFDRQIVAIAKVEGARTIYSDDKSLRNAAERAGLTVTGMDELPLPPVSPQTELGLFEPLAHREVGALTVE